MTRMTQMRPPSTDDPTLFTAAESTAPSEPGRVVFLTNRHNLLEALASGMIAARDSYTKYYDDLLALSPGRVPLVRAPLAADVCELASGGESNAFPVALELDPDFFPAGPMPALGPLDGIARVGDSNAAAWISPSPIPLSAVKTVHFRSANERKEFERRQYENVPSLSMPVAVSPHLFEGGSTPAADLRGWLVSAPVGATNANVTTDTMNPPPAEAHQTTDRLAGALCLIAVAAPPRRAALAAVGALLSRHPAIASTNAGATEAAPKKVGRKSKSRPKGEARADSKTEASEIPRWILAAFGGEPAPGGDDLEVRLFGVALRVLSAITRSAGWRPTDVLTSIETELRASAALTAEQDIELGRTMEYVRAIVRAERELKPFRPDAGLDAAKALLMVLLRPEPERLLAWPREEIGATESVWLTAVAYAGALTGLKRLPTATRPEPLHAYLGEWAVERLTGPDQPSWVRSGEPKRVVDVVAGADSLSLTIGAETLVSIPVAPPSLAERVAALDVDNADIAERLAAMCRVLGWADCVWTTITIAGSPLTVNPERRGTAVTVRITGWPEISTSLNPEKLHSRLSREGIRPDEEARVVETLGSALG